MSYGGFVSVAGKGCQAGRKVHHPEILGLSETYRLSERRTGYLRIHGTTEKNG